MFSKNKNYHWKSIRNKFAFDGWIVWIDWHSHSLCEAKKNTNCSQQHQKYFANLIDFSALISDWVPNCMVRLNHHIIINWNQKNLKHKKRLKPILKIPPVIYKLCTEYYTSADHHCHLSCGTCTIDRELLWHSPLNLIRLNLPLFFETNNQSKWMTVSCEWKWK